MGVDTKIAPRSLNFEIKSAPLTKMCQFETNCCWRPSILFNLKDSLVENIFSPTSFRSRLGQALRFWILTNLTQMCVYFDRNISLSNRLDKSEIILNPRMNKGRVEGVITTPPPPTTFRPIKKLFGVFDEARCGQLAFSFLSNPKTEKPRVYSKTRARERFPRVKHISFRCHVSCSLPLQMEGLFNAFSFL